MQISRKECEKFKMAINFDYDFSGWATKANVKCFDGLTIAPNAFKDCDGKTVPVVWNHDHSAPESVLGHALLQNFDFQKVGFQVDTAFDVSPALIGTKIHDVTIRPMEELEHYVEEYHPNVAVLTVPQSVAQPLADRLIALGVKGFWNFTNVELSTQTKGVFFEDIHFVDTLLTLSYRISRPEELY